MKKRISAIIPTFNEEDFIEEAIKSLAFADEIIVLDSYSSDKTPELAQKHGVRFIQRSFDDFSSQKNFAIEKTKHDWIFLLDADERVSLELETEIMQTLCKEVDEVGYFIGRNFYFLRRRISHGGWQTDKVMRLFNKKHCKYDGKLVHEKIAYTGKAGLLKHRLDHFSYRSFDHYSGKLNYYASLQAQELYLKNAPVNFFYLLIKPFFRFFVLYIIRFGFLDGLAGFILAVQHSFGVFSRYAKLWLLKNSDLADR